MISRQTRRGWYINCFLTIIFAIAVLYSVCIHLSDPIMPYDDAYITFRHSENLYQGQGFVYNPGERVFGVSTPLYAIWLTILRFFTPSIEMPVSAVRANVIFYLATGIGILLLVYRYTQVMWLATIASAAFLTNRFLLGCSIGGMEPFLFTSLLIFALLAASYRLPITYGLLASLAMLTRLEGIILLPIGIIAFIKKDSINWKSILKLFSSWATLLVIWAAAATLYWGTPIPHSIKAKAAPLYPLPPGHAASEIFKGIGDQLLVHLTNNVPTRIILLQSFVLITLFVVLAVPSYRHKNAYAPALCFLAFLMGYLYWNPLMFEWYLPKLYVTAYLSILLGVMAFYSEIKEKYINNISKIIRILLLSCMILWLFSITIIPEKKGQPYFTTPIVDIATNPERTRIISYIEIAKWLNERTNKKTVMAASEIGALGFYFKGKVLDGNGLVSAEALPFLPVPAEQRLGPQYGALSIELIRETLPDWIVSMRVFTCKSLNVSDWFKSNYILVEIFGLPMTTFGDTAINVYKRRDI